MSKELDEIAQKYAVKVGVDESLKGSGVLVKSEDNSCYLFTAKHNFKDKEKGENTHKDVKKENIINIIETIYIEKVVLGETKVYMKKLLFFENDLDLVVFLLDFLQNSFFNRHTSIKINQPTNKINS